VLTRLRPAVRGALRAVSSTPIARPSARPLLNARPFTPLGIRQQLLASNPFRVPVRFNSTAAATEVRPATLAGLRAGNVGSKEVMKLITAGDEAGLLTEKHLAEMKAVLRDHQDQLSRFGKVELSLISVGLEQALKKAALYTASIPGDYVGDEGDVLSLQPGGALHVDGRDGAQGGTWNIGVDAETQRLRLDILLADGFNGREMFLDRVNEECFNLHDPYFPDTAMFWKGKTETTVSKAARETWPSVYWPMAGDGTTDGDPQTHLWAKGGVLEKFDQVLAARKHPHGARAFELKPALNWLIDKPSGHYIPHRTISEANAEVTTGVDFDGDGQLKPDTQVDFLDARGEFGKDGKTDKRMDVGWWGSCDKVALAGILFDAPKREVTLNGVTFTPNDIKGLLTVIAESQSGGTETVGHRYDDHLDKVTLADGRVLRGKISTEIDWDAPGVTHHEDWIIPAKLPELLTVKLSSGKVLELPREKVREVRREDARGDPVLYHRTLQEWLGSGKAAAMDKDPGPHVWNYAFHQVRDVKWDPTGMGRPAWIPQTPEQHPAGFRGPPGDGKLSYVSRTVTFGGGNEETHHYWLEEKDGNLVNGGWLSRNHPDFLWRPVGEATFTGANPRNPFVDPKIVREIYEASLV
jgi:hypothetical protein